jgi:hypothetical protein
MLLVALIQRRADDRAALYATAKAKLVSSSGGRSSAGGGAR